MEFSEVEQARSLLRRHLTPTRLVEAAGLGRETGARVFLKLESENPTGSFKVRGARSGKTVVLLVTGANLTPEVLRKSVEAG